MTHSLFELWKERMTLSCFNLLSWFKSWNHVASKSSLVFHGVVLRNQQSLNGSHIKLSGCYRCTVITSRLFRL